jgi:sterol desaturase/sphingolipid hydroxylase (fatty acid hydroxylase superfamily)
MWQALLSTKGYFFWLLVVSALAFVLERLFTWRKNQSVWRKEIGQDLFFLIFNGHYAGLLIATLATYLLQQLAIWTNTGDWMNQLQAAHWIAGWPIVAQVITFMLIKDFISWWVHRLLHSVPWMWEFHKLHHSITQMDWIGNFRFHWMEIVIYRAFTFMPLMVLGVSGDIILVIAVVETLIGHLNHANIAWGWGPLGYVFNSPRFHAWHHDVENHGRHGQNFAIIFSFWDWLFGTAYWPKQTDMPAQFGFADLAQFPSNLLKRLTHPFWKIFYRQPAEKN